jgi:glycosyltransferase involved in cell wall biosynthesis
MIKKKITLPDISVIVCAYNHDKWIERCIRSIKNQSIINNKEVEIIIVDDGSRDHTSSVISNLKELTGIKIIKNKKNLGLPKSINIAIKAALGRYIVRVDSDDYISRNFLYISKLFLDKNREYQAVATDYYKVTDDEKIIKKVNCFKEEIACGIMFRKEALFDIGLYNENFTMREGHELKKRFKKKFNLGRLEFPLYKYRQHLKNRTKQKKILRKYDKLLKKIKK